MRLCHSDAVFLQFRRSSCICNRRYKRCKQHCCYRNHQGAHLHDRNGTEIARGRTCSAANNAANSRYYEAVVPPRSRFFLSDGSLRVAKAKIVKWDVENDLALLAADLDIPPLELSEYEPWPGYWNMALGSADGYEGSVSFGTVLNTTTNQLLLTNNISKGNSGGPVVDNEGNVVGVVTFLSKDEQYNVAMSLNAFCAKILKCEKDYYWKRD